MSVTERPQRATTALEELPDFDLSYLYDDSEEPTEVTVFPGDCGDELATNWITVDAGHAVPLEDIR